MLSAAVASKIFPVPILLAAICAHGVLLARAQYSEYGGYAMANNNYRTTNEYGGSSGGGYGGGGYGGGDAGYEGGYGAGGGDERPKVQLGIRLKIPAFRFELPRFSLPKITISAKIRQPERPRTITLPEINLDTSSKVAPPGAQNGGGGGGYGASYGGSAPKSTGYSSGGYSSSGGGNGESERTISFSTEEAKGPSYGVGQTMDYANQNQGGYGAQSGYSSTNVHHSYAEPAPTAQQQQQQQLDNQIAGHPQDQYASNSDMGFNVAPKVYEGPEARPMADRGVSHSYSSYSYARAPLVQQQQQALRHAERQHLNPLRVVQVPRFKR